MKIKAKFIRKYGDIGKEKYDYAITTIGNVLNRGFGETIIQGAENIEDAIEKAFSIKSPELLLVKINEKEAKPIFLIRKDNGDFLFCYLAYEKYNRKSLVTIYSLP